MKNLIITDTHAGCRNDSPHFNDYTIAFYKNILFPFIKNNSIKKIVHLGDVFDRRKYINFHTLSLWIDHVFTPLHDLIDRMDIIIGNHDCYFTNTNDVNSVSLIFKDKFPKFKIYTNPVEVDNVLYLPWICDDNLIKTCSMIDNSNCVDCFGHLEIIGFEHFKGHINEDKGQNREVFKKFRNVLTGHFHHKSTQGNIHYLGAPYEMNWSDCDDPKGFHLYDYTSGELTFIQNPLSIFKKTTYESIDTYIKEDFKNKFVKMIAPNNYDPVKLDKFKEEMDSVSITTSIVTLDTNLISLNSDEDYKIDVKDTLSILKDGTNEQEIDKDQKIKLFDLLSRLYNDALNISNDRI